VDGNIIGVASVADPLRARSTRAALRPLPGGRSEHALIARVRAGDDEAFEALYDAYHARLLTFCRHMLGSLVEAEDVVQHTFLAAYRSLRGGYEVVDLKPWLYAIARNGCLSVVRRRREDAALDDSAPATEGLAAEVDRRADLRLLVRDVQRLPPDQRAALILSELGDHSHREIAAVLGVRREKVKALVFQAREALTGWRTARETPCAHVREQLATLTGSALGRSSIRRHVEQCPGCADFEAAVRGQRAALAIALPVVPAVGLRAAVLGSTIGGGAATTGAAVSTGATMGTAGSLAAIGAKGVAAKVLVVTVLVGGAGAARQAIVDQPHRGREAAATRPVHAAPAPATWLARLALFQATAAAVHPAATTPAADRRANKAAAKAAHGKRHGPRGRGKAVGHGKGAAQGHAAAKGKATAPGQLKAPRAPAEGKALGKGTAHSKHAASKAPKAARKAPKAARKAPKPTKSATPAAPRQSTAGASGQAKKDDALPPGHAGTQHAELPRGQAKKQ
jgi:RNA polymerase sigma factor (sigma-70 family)